FSGNNRICRDRFKYEGHGSDAAPFTNHNGTENGYTYTDRHVVLNRRVTFLLPSGSGTPPASCAQGDLVIEHNIVANNCCLTNDDTCTVIDEEAFANLCARMNLDTARYKACKM